MQTEPKKIFFGVKVTNFDHNVTRAVLKQVFSAFANIIKLYITPPQVPKPYAWIYFKTKAEQDKVLQAFKVNPYNWIVDCPPELNGSRSSLDKESDEMDDVEEYTDYVDVYGRQVTVYKCDNGDILVPLREIKQTGFALFPKEYFDAFLINTEQIKKEFKMHLLAEAKKFCIKNKTYLSEDVIVDTIKRCEEIVLNENNENGNKSNTLMTQSNKNHQGRNIVATNDNLRVTVNSSPSNNNRRKQPNTKPNFSTTDLPATSTSRANYNPVQRQQIRTGGSTPQLTMRPPRNIPIANKHIEVAAPSNGVVIENKKPPAKLRQIKTLELQIGSEYDVNIVIKQKPNYYWGQWKNNANDDVLSDILLKLNTGETDLVDTEPVVGKFCVAEYENIWYRAAVIKTTPTIEVLYIDYGNKAVVDSVKELPSELYDIPIQAILFKIEKDLHMETLYRLTCLKENSDGSYDVSVQSDEKKTFFNNPEPLCAIKNKDKIKILDFDDIFFYVRTKQCTERLSELRKYIDNLDKQPVENVEIGQMVLCARENRLVRAKVIKNENKAVRLKYIDFTGEESLTLNSLRNVDERIANEPCLLLKTPEFNVLKTVKTDKPNEYLQNLITNSTILTVALNGDHFDLELQDSVKGSQMLSVILSDLESAGESSAEENVESNNAVVNATKKPMLNLLTDLKLKKQSRTFFTDMKQLDVKLGVGIYDLYCFESLDSLTIMNSNESDYMERLISYDLNDDEPYSAEEEEVCMALYLSDATPSWYRGVVMAKNDKDYQIMFIDFGNTEKVDASNIRKLPAELKDIPILGLYCELTNIPKKPEVFAALQKIVEVDAPITVDIKEVSTSGRYLIEIPSAYEELRKQGLI